MIENKLNQLIEIINLEKEKMEKSYTYFSEDEMYKRVLLKYKDLLDCLKTKNYTQIFDFLESLIEILKSIINKCSNPKQIVSTYDVVIDTQTTEIESTYELNEYFNIVFYLYNLFLNRDFNRSDSLKYSFSIENLENILNKCQETLK